MKRAMLALAAMTVLATSSGCCCLERMFCGWGCCGGMCDDCCGPYDGCGDCGCDDCGGGCDDCGGGQMMHGGPMMDGHMGGDCNCGHASHAPRGRQVAKRMHPRQADMEAQAAYNPGPPTAQVTYPYYTNRGPRDFLARSPRSIGP